MKNKTNWLNLKIGDFSKVKGGKRLPKGYFLTEQNTGFPYIRVKDFGDGKLNEANICYITEEAQKKIERYTISSEDVYLSIAGTIGAVGIVPEKLSGANLTENAAKIVVDKKRADKYFLKYFLQSQIGQSKIKAQTGGASQPKLALFRIENIELLLPDLVSQRDIAKKLVSIDALIDHNTRRIKILQKLAQQIYEEWFVHFKFPSHEKVKMVDSELGEIPEGWNIVKAGEIIDFDPKTSVNKNSKNKYLSMGSISEFSMIISNIKMRKGNSGSKFQNKDTLLARISPSLENGKTGFVNFLKKDETAFGSTELIVMRSKTVCPEYVYCLARSSKFRATAIKSMRGATGRQRVQKDALENYKVALPNDNKFINEFHSALESIFNQAYLLNAKNEVLVETRDLLLPRLISGEIKV
jgi:type I restriction enzyme S subunit